MHPIKRILVHLPEQRRQGLKRLMYARQIRAGHFASEEPEWTWVGEVLREGDWVLDIGANVGHYTVRFSGLVGRSGRVIAFEPIPDTFDLLASNAALFPHRNVTLLNAAASDACRVVPMVVPHWAKGDRNYYEAHIGRPGENGAEADTFHVLCCIPDALEITQPIRLAKVDAEGHEPAVLKGMRRLIERDLPILILETPDDDTSVDDPEHTAMNAWLADLGYTSRRLPGSPNRIYTAPSKSPVGAGATATEPSQK